MNYSELSDDAINMEVTERFFGCEKWDYNEKDRCFFHCGIDGSGYYSQPIIDFCGRPENAWPIIIDNEISIIRDVSTNDAWEAIPKGWVTMNGFESSIDNKLCHIDKNPLRAAMITFLMMSEN